MNKLPKEFKVLDVEKKNGRVNGRRWALTVSTGTTRNVRCSALTRRLRTLQASFTWTRAQLDVLRYRCQIQAYARHYNVYFPQGWDCHGLPIEVEVEKKNNIRKTDIPADAFRKLCMELVDKYIGVMKESIKRLGCSIDWSTEYRTMDPDYWRRTQHFVHSVVQEGFHVSWDTSCQLSVPDARLRLLMRKLSMTLATLRCTTSNSTLKVTVFWRSQRRGQS